MGSLRGLVISIGIGLVLVIIFVISLFRLRSQSAIGPSQPPRASASNIPTRSLGPNKVVRISPQDKATNIPENSNITITLLNPIAAQSDIEFRFSPKLPYDDYSTEETFPTKIITVNPKALLSPGTTYTMTVLYGGNPIALSSFTITSQPKAQSDPQSVTVGEAEVQQEYPLLKEMPFDTTTISVRYTAPLSLSVRILQGTKDQAQTEVETWMRSKGIDPSTHKLTFTNG